MPQHLRILMVEDSATDAMLIERELRRAGVEFSLKRVDGESAFREELETSDPDVILGDYHLPAFDGIAALRIALSTVPDKPFIFVSGAIGEERAVEALRDGATDYILKDRLSRLPSAITRAVDQSRDRKLRHRAQELLDRVSRQNELILNSAAEGIIGIDRNAKPFMVNPSAAVMTGFTVEEFRAAKTIHELIHHSHRDASPYPSEECPILEVLGEGMTVAGEDVFWKKSGEPFTAEFSASPIHEGNTITGCVVMFQDITERKRLENKIQQAQRVASLGRVAATIAHEFNNVLMGIQPFAEIIRRSTAEEKVSKAASHIINSVARGTRVTESILRFTQPAEPAMSTVEITEWMRNLMPELQARVGEGIRVELDAPAEPLMINCDSAQMQQVITNLVVNARDAMPKGGTIRVGVTTKEDDAITAIITVQDEGLGMPPHVLQNIFEPLFTTKRSGTGLGLAVVQQIVEHHGGSIAATSTVGKGSEFIIALPLAADGERQKEDQRDRDPCRLNKLLLVDDDATVAHGLQMLLESEGIRVETVDRGARVIDAICASNPDAVVLDASLPDGDGAAIYEEIVRRWPELPVIISTANGDAPAIAKQSRTVAFLRKPYDLNALLDVIASVSEVT